MNNTIKNKNILTYGFNKEANYRISNPRYNTTHSLFDLNYKNLDNKKVAIKNINLKLIENSEEKSITKNIDKIYINLTALDKITAKTSSIRLAVGDKKFFGSLEIKALKCQAYEGNDTSDTVAYIQVKDLSTKDNNQVFLFNGWTFVSSPTLKPIDHPIYDLWIISCENIY